MDCRTCKHNTYIDIKDCDFVSCSHETAIRKTPKPEPGDPVWIDVMTADMRASDMEAYQNCPTYEPAEREGK